LSIEKAALVAPGIGALLPPLGVKNHWYVIGSLPVKAADKPSGARKTVKKKPRVSYRQMVRLLKSRDADLLCRREVPAVEFRIKIWDSRKLEL